MKSENSLETTETQPHRSVNHSFTSPHVAFRGWIWGIGVVALLSACHTPPKTEGGPTAPTQAPATVEKANPTAGAPTLPASDPSTSSAHPCALPQLRPAIIAAVNAQRAKPRRCGRMGQFPAAPPLTWNSVLLQATQGHAQMMATTFRFSHLGADGRNLDQRVDAVGYAWTALAENIGLGYESVDEVVRGWMASDGHCANLMKPEMRDMAAACVVASDGVPYWALDLAAPKGGMPASPAGLLRQQTRP